MPIEKEENERLEQLAIIIGIIDTYSEFPKSFYSDPENKLINHDTRFNQFRDVSIEQLEEFKSSGRKELIDEFLKTLRESDWNYRDTFLSFMDRFNEFTRLSEAQRPTDIHDEKKTPSTNGSPGGEIRMN